MDAVNVLDTANRRTSRLNEVDKRIRDEYYHKLDVLNEIYSIAFPEYKPEGNPLCSMPFVGDAKSDKVLERQLIRAIERKFKEK